MAKIVTRQNLRQFGRDGNSTNYGQFGSVEAGTPLKTKNIATIQALGAWLTGWQDAVVSGNKAPFLEDMNSAMYVLFYELFYLLQEGIAEWNAETTYFVGSMVRKPGTVEIYTSLTNDNLNNALPVQTDNINWSFVYPVRTSTLLGEITAAQIASGAIITGKIATSAVSEDNIAALAVTNAKISAVDAGKITGLVDVPHGGTGVNNKILSIIAYIGDGNDNRVLAHGLQTNPLMVMIIGTASNAPWALRGSNFGSAIKLSNGVSSTNAIKSMDGTNVTLGTDPSVNQNGTPYVLIAAQTQ